MKILIKNPCNQTIKKKNINNDNISEFQEIKELNSYIISFSEINFSNWDF